MYSDFELRFDTQSKIQNILWATKIVENTINTPPTDKMAELAINMKT